MLVDDEIAVAVAVLPIAPERQPQTVPAHPREMRHVLVDPFLSVGAQVFCGAVIARRREAVVRAKEGHLALIRAPPNDAPVVDIHELGMLCCLRGINLQPHGGTEEESAQSTHPYHKVGVNSGTMDLGRAGGLADAGRFQLSSAVMTPAVIRAPKTKPLDKRPR